MRLFWHGMTAVFEWEGQIAGIDIGGGTVEFMWGTKDKLEGYKLLKTGVLVMREKYIKSDPATEEEFGLMESEIRKEIVDLEIKFSPETPFIHGSTSVIDFYREAGVKMGEFKYSKSHPFKVDLGQTRRFYKEIR